MQTRSIIFVLGNLLCNTMAWRMADLFFPLLAQSKGIPELQIGLFSTANTLMMILMLIPAGIAADLITQKKALLALATLVQSVVQFVYPIVNTSLGFLFVSLIQGLAFAMYTPAILSLITYNATVHTSGRYVSVYTGILTVGMSLGSYTGGILADLVSLPYSYFLFGLVALLSIGFLLLPTEQPKVSRSTSTLTEQVKTEIQKLVGGTSRNLRPLYAGILLRAIGFFSFYLYFPLYVTQLGLPNSILGAADAVNNATSFFAILALGYIVTKISAKALLLIGFYGHVLLTSFFVITTTTEQLFLVMVFAGSIWAAMKIGTLTLITQQTAPSDRGKQNSLESMSYNAGRIIGAPINGYLIQLGSGFTYSYWFTGLACLFGSVFLHLKLNPTKISGDTQLSENS